MDPLQHNDKCLLKKLVKNVLLINVIINVMIEKCLIGTYELKNASKEEWIQSRQLNKGVNIRDASSGQSFSSKHTASKKGHRISMSSPVGSLNCCNFWLTHCEIKAWHGFVGLHWTSRSHSPSYTGFRIPQWTLSVFIMPIKPSLNHKSWAWWWKTWT